MTPKHHLIRSSHMLGSIHGNHAVGRFNSALAMLITKNVGTMWCAYVFAVIGIASLVGAFTGNIQLTLIAGGISSYFLQLVLLPVIIVGQNIIQAASDARAETDHETLTAIHDLTQHIDSLQETQLQILNKLK